LNSEQSNNRVSRICFGTWGLAGSTANSPAYGAVDLQDSKRLLEVAINEYGINFFDTSPAYSEGVAEELLGHFSKVHNLIICTKVGRLNLSESPNWKVDVAKQSLEKSFIRLKREHIDIVLLHSPELEDLENIGFLYEYLLELKSKGLIGQIGISLKSPLHWEKFKIFDFDFIQTNFNLLDVRAYVYFPEWESKKIKVLTRGPFASGILTNKNIDFQDKSDHRSRWNKDLRNLLTQNRLLLTEKFPTIQNNLEEVALKFVDSFQNITSIVVSIMSRDELSRNVSNSSKDWKFEFTPEDLLKNAQTYF
jgi:aryl-alcohol dehydrogenase-like predicted oxidoreductase